jgi:hypothetical protein
VDDTQPDAFLKQFAPNDVQDTVAWLIANGYPLVAHRGESTFGAQFVYVGDTKVLVTVDRGQWMLDVAVKPEDEWNYEVLLVAHADQPYEVFFPRAGARAVSTSLPAQLPEGVSWRETLPAILQWVTGDDVPVAVERAREERSRLRRPEASEG